MGSPWPLSGFVPLSIVCLGAQSVLQGVSGVHLEGMGRRVLSFISLHQPKPPVSVLHSRILRMTACDYCFLKNKKALAMQHLKGC